MFWSGIRGAGIEGVTKSKKFHPDPTLKPPTPAWRLKGAATPRAVKDVRGLGCTEHRLSTLIAMEKYKKANSLTTAQKVELQQTSVTENYSQARRLAKTIPPPQARPSAPDGSDWYSWQLYTQQPVRSCETMRSPRVDKRPETPENLKSNPVLMAQRDEELKSRRPPLPTSDPWKHEWFDVKPETSMRQTIRPSGGLSVSMAFCTPPRSASTGCLLDSELRQTSRLSHWTTGRDRWRQTVGR